MLFKANSNQSEILVLPLHCQLELLSESLAQFRGDELHTELAYLPVTLYHVDLEAHFSKLLS